MAAKKGFIFICPRYLIRALWMIANGQKSSRGLGHELVRYYLKNTPDSIPLLATARSNLDEVRHKILSNGLESKKDRLHVTRVDVTKPDTIESVSEYIKSNLGTYPIFKSHLMR